MQLRHLHPWSAEHATLHLSTHCPAARTGVMVLERRTLLQHLLLETGHILAMQCKAVGQWNCKLLRQITSHGRHTQEKERRPVVFSVADHVLEWPWQRAVHYCKKLFHQSAVTSTCFGTNTGVSVKKWPEKLPGRTMPDALREGWIWNGFLQKVKHGLQEGGPLCKALWSCETKRKCIRYWAAANITSISVPSEVSPLNLLFPSAVFTGSKSTGSSWLGVAGASSADVDAPWLTASVAVPSVSMGTLLCDVRGMASMLSTDSLRLGQITNGCSLWQMSTSCCVGENKPNPILFNHVSLQDYCCCWQWGLPWSHLSLPQACWWKQTGPHVTGRLACPN